MSKDSPQPKYDWEYFEWLYVTGDDRVTLEELSKRPGAPSFDTLKKYSSAESWTAKRTAYRHKLSTETRKASLEDDVSIRTRQLDIAKVMQRKGLEILTKLETKVGTFNDARQMITDGVKLERLILGESTENMTVSAGRAYLEAIFIIVREEVNDVDTLTRIAGRVRELGPLGNGPERPADPTNLN